MTPDTTGLITALIAIISAVWVGVIATMTSLKVDRMKRLIREQPDLPGAGDDAQLTMLKASVHRRACIGLIIAASTAILNGATLLWLIPASRGMSGWHIFLWCFNIAISLPQMVVFLWLNILRRVYRPSPPTRVSPAGQVA